MDQQIDLNQFNSLIESANNTISCNSDCKRNKRATSLKHKMMKAKSRVVLAEPEYQNAIKNYYVYVAGEGGYNEMMENKYTQIAEEVIEQMRKHLYEITASITEQLEMYSSLLVNFRNVVDLYTQYKEENKTLAKNLKEDANDIITNERKTYYEDQGIDTLDTYYYYFFVIMYIIVFICFVIFDISRNINKGSLLKLIILPISFCVLLPFITLWAMKILIIILYWLSSMFPKNVYSTL